MRFSVWIAIGLFALVAAWLASGFLIDDDDEEAQREAAQVEEPAPTLVEVRTSTAEPVPQYIYAQGVAQPYRTTDVNTSTGGTLEEVEVQQGEVVEAGAVLARVRLDARQSQLQSARAQVESLEADLQAARELAEQGFATESRVRELESQLESARANLESIRSDIRDTTIEAPIAGIVSDVFVNSGETLTAGTAIARIVDNAPLRVELNISQRNVGSVDVGREAVVSFATDALAKGRVCFVAPAADPQTRTFRVEIRVPNEERTIPSVVSTEVRFQTGEASAHFISPAILSLDEAGVLGVKSVAEDDTVRFHPVDIVRAEGDGIWVAGLTETLRLITVGQGFVREGDAVRTREEDSAENGTAAGGMLGRAPLPTATVEAEAFEGAAELPDPPPADELCQGSAANPMRTSAVPGSSGEGAAAPAGGPDQQQGGAGAGGVESGSQGQASPDETNAPNGGGGTTQPGPDISAPQPTSPEIPSPRPDGGASAPPAGGNGGGTDVAPPSEVEGVEP